MTNQEQFKDQIADFLQGLTQSEKNKWLENFYKRYSDRHIKDNERIWNVTGIFIPLSLAGLSSIKEASFTSVLLIGIGSITLITFWYIICEKHRKFLNDSEELILLIENQLGFNSDLVESPYNKRKNFLQRLLIKSRIGQLRGWIAGIIVGIWIVTITITYLK